MLIESEVKVSYFDRSEMMIDLSSGKDIFLSCGNVWLF